MSFIQADIIIRNLFALFFVIAFAADTSLIIIINNRVDDIANSYYSFHKKIGVIKVTILKIFVVMWIIYGLIIEPSGKSGTIFTIITAYWINLFKLFADYRKTKSGQRVHKEP